MKYKIKFFHLIYFSMFTLLGNHNTAARREYLLTNRESFVNDNPLDEFDIEWYPKCWIVFVYMAGASDQPAGDANPFKPRGMADKLLVETRHLEHKLPNNRQPQASTNVELFDH